MSILIDRIWKTKYTSDGGDLVKSFYVPALECATRYDRTTGYFSATALALASRGIEGLVRNDGRMRLVVGCTLHPQEVEAIKKGADLRAYVDARVGMSPLNAADDVSHLALELLSWMVAKGILDVKVAVPCSKARLPVASDAIFHEKAGIIEDKTGSRIAFNGSINETGAGWTENWESFHVYTDWTGTKDHVDAEDSGFARLWADKAERALVLDVPEAARNDLLRFLPQGDLPTRLISKTETVQVSVPAHNSGEVEISEPPPAPFDPRQLAWGLIRYAAQFEPGGERVGEATCGIQPWPHQVRAFHRLYDAWPPKLLVADEVGLGKTIEAGMMLRQAWLSGRAKRILILAPKGILRQWQVELREKFNLNWPIYDGHKLAWYPTRSLVIQGLTEREVDRKSWHKEPVVLASSQLMRRVERRPELIHDADPWDLVIVDEAHHARRKSAGSAKDGGPNHLLRLLRELRAKTDGLVLMTATPMQVSPIEVWDLLDLLGLPQDWSTSSFLAFFQKGSQINPSNDDMAFLAKMFRSVESTYGELSIEDAKRYVDGGSSFKTKKVLGALRDQAVTPLKQLDSKERQYAIRIMMACTPVGKLVSRHTRELLRAYYKSGKISTRVPERIVEDRFVKLTDAERTVYDAVENYISSTYNAATPDKRSAVGFVMTTYRRRLASSFYALRRTLEKRKGAVGAPSEDDVLDNELADDAMDIDEAAELEKQALETVEKAGIDSLLRDVRRLPRDTKYEALLEVLRTLRAKGHQQGIVFTQYTDTMNFLRDELSKEADIRVVCFSGRGGEQKSSDGTWQTISRENVKRVFREGHADILLCTDAAAEGLNFQFCGALVNYDLPWNPMRVEQRIGRIDRLGQRYEEIRIVNLHYDDTVEADVYKALRERIGLFTKFVGRLQPILARLPKEIAQATLGPKEDRDRVRANLVGDIGRDAAQPPEGGFDIDLVTQAEIDEPERPNAPYDLRDLDSLIRRSKFLPPGVNAQSLGKREYAYSAPGLSEPLRVTTDPEYFDNHFDSTELWSPGSPLFPEPEQVATLEQVVEAATTLRELLHDRR